MKILRIMLLFVAVTMGAMSANADKYSDGLKKLLDLDAISQLSGSNGIKELAKGTGQINEAYFADQFKQDMADMLAPYYRKNMSEKSFDQYVEYYSRPEIVEVQKNVLSNLSDIKSVIGDPRTVVMTIMTGGTPEAVKPVECDAKKIAKIEKYLQINETDKTMSNALNSLLEVMSQKMAGNAPAEQMEMVNKLLSAITKYMNDNIKTIVRNSLVNSVTEEQLDMMNAVEKQPFFPEEKKTNEALANDMPKIISTVFDNITKK